MKELPVMKPYIGGEWIESESTKFTTIYDPSTGKPIAQVPQCTAAEVEKAIAAAKNAPQSAYPKCQLCVENEGYAGRMNHPARANRIYSHRSCYGDPPWLRRSHLCPQRHRLQAGSCPCQ